MEGCFLIDLFKNLDKFNLKKLQKTFKSLWLAFIALFTLSLFATVVFTVLSTHLV